MAVKTITIDIDAYEILSRQKRPGQSFSTVIKEHFGKHKNCRSAFTRIAFPHLDRGKPRRDRDAGQRAPSAFGTHPAAMSFFDTTFVIDLLREQRLVLQDARIKSFNSWETLLFD